MKKIRFVLLFSCIFSLGFFSGGLFLKEKINSHLIKLSQSDPLILHDSVLSSLAQDLGWDGKTIANVSPILMHGVKECQEIRERYYKFVRECVMEHLSLINVHLSPEQATQLSSKVNKLFREN